MIKQRQDNEYTWNLSDMFMSDETWQTEFDCLTALITDIKPDDLATCLEKVNMISERLGRVYVYAHMKLHEDGTNSFYKGLADKADMLQIKFASATSFIEPLILSMDDEKIHEFVESNPVYAHYINNLLRAKAHVLSAELEEFLADTMQIAEAPDNIFSMLNNADMEFGEINGEQLTHGSFIRFMESTNRETREKTFNTYYDAYMKQKNTLASLYSASVKNDVFFARKRKFHSSLQKALFTYNIPDEVYNNLIQSVHDYLPVLHDYTNIREKKLGHSLHIYDMYVPIVNDVDTQIPFEQAKDIITKALSPMGDEYVSLLHKAFDNRWIDVYENKGKRSGAYSWGAYGTHPYILMNYDGKIDDMFTLAHELGHSIHSYYSWSNQPYIYSSYTIFLAEIASTVNEVLLMEYLLKTTDDAKFRAYLINYSIEQFRRTVFRQTMFAEFEFETHKLIENDSPLTVDVLNNLYRDLNRKYHGEKVFLDDKSDIEWARIPHFYNAFYVYQYATGFSIAVAFAKKILSGDMNYYELLKSGSSDYTMNILKRAGIDTPLPICDALDYFKELVNKFTNEI